MSDLVLLTILVVIGTGALVYMIFSLFFRKLFYSFKSEKVSHLLLLSADAYTMRLQSYLVGKEYDVDELHKKIIHIVREGSCVSEQLRLVQVEVRALSEKYADVEGVRRCSSLMQNYLSMLDPIFMSWAAFFPKDVINEFCKWDKEVMQGYVDFVGKLMKR